MSWVPKEVHIEKIRDEIARQKQLKLDWLEYRAHCKTGSPMDRDAKRRIDHAEKTIKRLEQHIKEMREE